MTTPMTQAANGIGTARVGRPSAAQQPFQSSGKRLPIARLNQPSIQFRTHLLTGIQILMAQAGSDIGTGNGGLRGVDQGLSRRHELLDHIQ